MKTIKAFKCYCCGNLFNKNYGYSIAKRHIKGWHGEKEDHDLTFCSECAERMMLFARMNRKKSLKKLQEEIAIKEHGGKEQNGETIEEID